VLNHWRGEGHYETEVRILTPDRDGVVVSSQPTPVELTAGGYTDNVSFFVNVVFPSAGTYWVQTLADSNVMEEFPLMVADAGSHADAGPPDEIISETIN